MRKAQYDQLVKTLLPEDRVALWERAEEDMWRPTRKSAADWKLEEIALAGKVAAMAMIGRGYKLRSVFSHQA
jgi:hypothetical protein